MICEKMPRYKRKNDWIMLLTVLFSIFMTVHTTGAALINPEEENGGCRISVGEFVQMVSETLDAPIIQSKAEMSAMRFAYKAGWIESPEKSVFVTREQAADILVIASGNVIWLQDAAPFTDERDISENYRDAVSCAVKLGLVMGDPEGIFRSQDALTYQEAGYLMERLKIWTSDSVSTSAGEKEGSAHRIPWQRRNTGVRYSTTNVREFFAEAFCCICKEKK